MEFRDGVGYSTKSGALFISNGIALYGGNDGALFQVPAPVLPDVNSAFWSNWGNNNLLPLEMSNHLENCGVLQGAMEAKGRLATGKGVEPFYKTGIVDGEEVLEYCNEPEILDWLELNNMYNVGFELAYDRNGFGWNCGSFLLNGAKDYINRVRRIDVVTARIQKRTLANPKSKKLYICEDWQQAPIVVDGNKVVSLPLLRDGYEVEDIYNLKAGNVEFAFTNRCLRNGRAYYPYPLWWSARAWVKVARSVPAFKNAMFTNQVTIKMIISISDKYWENQYGDEWDDYDAKKRQQIIEDKYDEIDKWLTGEENQFKTLSSGCYYDPVTQKEVPYITITVIDDKGKDGKLLPESSAANSEILFAAMVSPSMIGAGQPGGPYSNNAGGSNIREGHTQQIMLLEPERKEISQMMNVVKRFNGWDKKYETAGKRLVFRYPAGILTTLDTGKATKNVSN